MGEGKGGSSLAESAPASQRCLPTPDFQNYLRTQTGNTNTINIIICTVDYLLRLQVRGSPLATPGLAGEGAAELAGKAPRPAGSDLL